jgi:hypothetical protein
MNGYKLRVEYWIEIQKCRMIYLPSQEENYEGSIQTSNISLELA